MMIVRNQSTPCVKRKDDSLYRSIIVRDDESVATYVVTPTNQRRRQRMVVQYGGRHVGCEGAPVSDVGCGGVAVDGKHM